MPVRQIGVGIKESIDNLLEVFYNTARGKRSRLDLAGFSFRLEPRLSSL